MRIGLGNPLHELGLNHCAQPPPSKKPERSKRVIEDLEKKLAEQDVVLTFDDKILTKIATEGFDEQFGARPTRRYIQDNIEDILAQKKLTNEIKRGSTVAFSTDAQNAISVHIT